MEALDWLSRNLAFSFVIGQFFGVFIIDAVHSARLVSRLKEFAEENGVIVRYENIKTHIREKQEQAKEKYLFFKPFQSGHHLSERLQEMLSSFEQSASKKS